MAAWSILPSALRRRDSTSLATQVVDGLGDDLVERVGFFGRTVEQRNRLDDSLPRAGAKLGGRCFGVGQHQDLLRLSPSSRIARTK